MDIREVLQNRILLMDGAMGTYFKSLHFDSNEAEVPEKAMLTSPVWIKDIHKEYICAGADIIRTNTFALNHNMERDTDKLLNGLEEGIRLAEEAVCESKEEGIDREIYIAVSMGPMKCTSEEEEEKVYQEYRLMIQKAHHMGMKIFDFETFSDIAMAKQLAAFVKEINPDAFVMVHFVFNKMGYTKYGFNMQRLINELTEDTAIDLFGFNCGIGAAHMSELFDKVVFPKKCLVGVLPNAGYQQELMGRDMYFNNAGYYAKYVEKLISRGVNVVGGCCGTTPEYTRALRKLLDRHPAPVEKQIADIKVRENQDKEENQFISKLNRGEKVYVVELDSPFGKCADKFIEGAFRLKENHVDMVTISDSPMAKARADAFEMAIYVQNKTGLSMMPHISCRDRNLIGIHSALLGAHINDIRNLLIITGDPVAREDRDVITPVFDFNSIKLMQYVQNMNEEVFGNEPFYYGGALNYATGKLELIVARMRKKIEAGCGYFLTQPIYSDEDIERVRALKKMTGAKILCGIMPLVSLKNARFMQNEMPGIHVPDEIVERYHADMKREDAEETAVQICVEIGRKMSDFADGYYIMTPFNRVQLVNRIIHGLRD